MTTMIAQVPRNAWQTRLLFIIAFNFSLGWRPCVRSILDGAAYHGGITYFGIACAGDGISLDYLFIVAELILYLALFYCIYWMRNRRLAHVILGVWFVHFFGYLIYDGLDGNMMFYGDALGVEIDLTYIVLVLALISLYAIVKIIISDRVGTPTSIVWNMRNKMMAMIILGPLPVQLLLLGTGEPQQTTDQIGVIISIFQGIAIPFVILPYTLTKNTAD